MLISGSVIIIATHFLPKRRLYPRPLLTKQHDLDIHTYIHTSIHPLASGAIHTWPQPTKPLGTHQRTPYVFQPTPQLNPRHVMGLVQHDHELGLEALRDLVLVAAGGGREPGEVMPTTRSLETSLAHPTPLRLPESGPPYRRRRGADEIPGPTRRRDPRAKPPHRPVTNM